MSLLCRQHHAAATARVYIQRGKGNRDRQCILEGISSSEAAVGHAPAEGCIRAAVSNHHVQLLMQEDV